MEKVAAVSASIMFFTAAFFFWGWLRDGCLLYQEWMQLFQSTSDYFLQMLSVPGGFAAWCSRFITQFFCIGWAGGACVALLLVGIQLLTFFLSARRSLLSYALSFLPAGAFWVAMCSEDAYIVPAVSVLLSLISALFLVVCTRRAGRACSSSVALVCTPLVWWLCGPFAFMFVAGTFFGNGRRDFLTASLQIVLLALCPFVASLFCSCTAESLAFGFFYSKIIFVHPSWSWIAALVCLVAVALPVLPLPDNRIVSAVVLVFALVLTAVGAYNFSNFRFDELMEYGGMVDREQWKEVADKFKFSPVTYDDVHVVSGDDGPQWCVNDTYTLRYACAALASAKNNRLLDDLFVRFCPGPEGLFPKYDRIQPVKNILASDIYYHLAMTSQSQEIIFEAKETISDYQKSARIYRRLARTNSINGNYAVSRKYLDALSNTLFSSSFAESFSDDSPEMKKFRKLRYRGRSYPINYEMLERELLDLVEQCHDNRMAMQYLVALVLLKKDVQYLNQVLLLYSRVFGEQIPDAVQQAYLVWLVNRDDFDGRIPPFVSADNVRKGQSFIEEYDRLPSLEGKKELSLINDLRRRYGGTYYFFYYLQ